jgi:hypothetical protein
MTFHFCIWRDGYEKHVATEDGPEVVWGEVFSLVAEDAKGFRWVLADSSTDNEALLQSALAGLAHDPAERPDLWISIDPCYGSDAWTGEDEFNLACFEADAFGEPRPNWR